MVTEMGDIILHRPAPVAAELEIIQHLVPVFGVQTQPTSARDAGNLQIRIHPVRDGNRLDFERIRFVKMFIGRIFRTTLQALYTTCMDVDTDVKLVRARV